MLKWTKQTQNHNIIAEKKEIINHQKKFIKEKAALLIFTKIIGGMRRTFDLNLLLLYIAIFSSRQFIFYERSKNYVRI